MVAWTIPFAWVKRWVRFHICLFWVGISTTNMLTLLVSSLRFELSLQFIQVRSAMCVVSVVLCGWPGPVAAALDIFSVLFPWKTFKQQRDSTAFDGFFNERVCVLCVASCLKTIDCSRAVIQLYNCWYFSLGWEGISALRMERPDFFQAGSRGNLRKVCLLQKKIPILINVKKPLM